MKYYGRPNTIGFKSNSDPINLEELLKFYDSAVKKFDKMEIIFEDKFRNQLIYLQKEIDVLKEKNKNKDL